MTPTLLFYTNALLPKPLLRHTLSRASETADKIGAELLVSSHVPLMTSEVSDCSGAFGHLAWRDVDPRFAGFLETQEPFLDPGPRQCNVVTGILSYSPETILTQIIHGIQQSSARTDCVLLWEHDVLYPEGYVETMCEALEDSDFAIYEDHLFLDAEGYFKPQTHFWHLSRYGAKKHALAFHFHRKVVQSNYGVLEPVPAGQGNGEETELDIVESFRICGGDPVLDVRHGANASGQILVDEHSDRHPCWGKLKKNGLPELLEDPDYDAFLESKPMIGYGLFTIKSSEVW
jgi:hypothetical protein